MLGNIKFIGELGKLDLIHESILHKCIKTVSIQIGRKLGAKPNLKTKKYANIDAALRISEQEHKTAQKCFLTIAHPLLLSFGVIKK